MVRFGKYIDSVIRSEWKEYIIINKQMYKLF